MTRRAKAKTAFSRGDRGGRAQVCAMRTKIQLIEECRCRGESVSPDQFDRWRDNGLFEAERSWPTPGFGSAAIYPVATVENLIAICQLLRGGRRSLERIGWELWWRGLPVAERVWQPTIERASRSIHRVVRFATGFVDRRDRDDRFADRTSEGSVRLDIFPEQFRRPALNLKIHGDGNLLNSASWRIAEAISDRADAGNLDYDSDETARELDAMATALGLSRARTDTVFGTRLDPRTAMRELLEALIGLQRVRPIDFRTQIKCASTIHAARDDMRKALGGAADFHDAVAWCYGAGAFGLKLARWICDESPPIFRAVLVVAWPAMQARCPSWTSAAISQLRDYAAATLDASRKLRAVAQSDPRLGRILTARRLKRALRTRGGHQILMAEIEQIRRA